MKKMLKEAEKLLEHIGIKFDIKKDRYIVFLFWRDEYKHIFELNAERNTVMKGGEIHEDYFDFYMTKEFIDEFNGSPFEAALCCVAMMKEFARELDIIEDKGVDKYISQMSLNIVLTAMNFKDKLKEE